MKNGPWYVIGMTYANSSMTSLLHEHSIEEWTLLRWASYLKTFTVCTIVRIVNISLRLSRIYSLNSSEVIGCL